MHAVSEPERSAIAALAPLVAQAVADGDTLAAGLFDEAARELAAMAGSVRQTLPFGPDDLVPVSYSGGVFKAGPLILDPLRRHLDEYCGNHSLQPPLLSPAGGAALYAARLATQPLSSAAVARLAGELPSS